MSLKEIKEYKRITDLYSFIIKADKTGREICTYKFYNKTELIIELRATVWQINRWREYKRYISRIKIPINKINNYNQAEIKRYLTKELYKQVIKNNKLMI